MNKEYPSPITSQNMAITPETKIGMVNSCFDKTPYEVSIKEAICCIRNGTWKHIVQAVRTAVNAGDKETANKLKQQLPGFLFAGTFYKRAQDGLKEPSGIIVLDFDNIAIDVEMMKERFMSECLFILAAFSSPSGRGIKVLVPISGSHEEHKIYFEYLMMYFKDKFGVELDPSGKDICRLCFVSYDERLFVNYNAQVLILTEAEKAHLANQVKSNKKTRTEPKATNIDELANVSEEDAKKVVISRGIDVPTLFFLLKPVDEGGRSEAFYKSVSLLNGFGCSAHEIATVLAFNSSFRDKYQGRLISEVKRVLSKLEGDDCLPAPIISAARMQTFRMKEAGI